MLESAIYTGTVRHRRFEPVRHEFSYELFMVLLDIDRIPELVNISPLAGYNRFRWCSFHDRDHFGDPAQSLRNRLRADASAHGVSLPDGPVFLLTHLRYLGYAFNPISYFYCFDASGRLAAVLAEVNSTFGETANYWLTESNRDQAVDGYGYRCRKELHVSPFLPMNLNYRFVLSPPAGRLVAHIAVSHGDRCQFDATLTMSRKPWTAAGLHHSLIRFPWMTAKVIAAIHWQALRLYLKGVPVIPHPTRSGRNG